MTGPTPASRLALRGFRSRPARRLITWPPRVRTRIPFCEFYKHLLGLRHKKRALLDGDYIALNQDDPNVLSFLRRYKNETILVVLNMSANPQKVSFDLTAQGLPAAKVSGLLSTASVEKISLSEMPLEPFAVYIAEVSKR